jgi:predicted small lipoprotein YifL
MLQRKNSVAAHDARVRPDGARHAAVMVLLLGLAACGQKGPLMLAKPTPAAAASSPAAAR